MRKVEKYCNPCPEETWSHQGWEIRRGYGGRGYVAFRPGAANAEDWYTDTLADMASVINAEVYGSHPSEYVAAHPKKRRMGQSIETNAGRIQIR